MFTGSSADLWVARIGGAISKLSTGVEAGYKPNKYKKPFNLFSIHLLFYEIFGEKPIKLK